jgi:hypothetical protein
MTMTFFEPLFVRQGSIPALPDRLMNSLDVSDAVACDPPMFDIFEVPSVDRFNQLFPSGDSGDAVEPVKRTRKRKPTLAGVARQAAKAGIEVARYEVRPDGINIITGKPSEATTPDNNNDSNNSNEWDGVLQ